MKQTTFEEFVDLAKRATFVPVCKEIVADLLTPVSAFLKIAEHSDYAFLLESVEGGEHVGRYSFLGKDPFLILRGRDGQTVIEQAGVTTDADEAVRRDAARPDEQLPVAVRAGPAALHRRRRRLPRLRHRRVVRADDRRDGDPPAERDDAGFMLFDTVLAFDHVQHRILLIANARISGDEDLKSLYQFACAKIEFLERELERALSLKRATGGDAVNLVSNMSQETFEAIVKQRQGTHRRRRHLPGRAVAALRGRGRRRRRSPSTARCATSIRRRTCSSSAWATARSSARRRRCWCASKAVTR